MPQSWAKRRRAYYKITVEGEDVTKKVDPHLIAITVSDKTTGEGFDSASIELDDRDGRLAIPSPKGQVIVLFGWADSGPEMDVQTISWPPHTHDGKVPTEAELGYEGGLYEVFRGTVNNVESSFQRGSGGGRRLIIEALGQDLDQAAKGPQLYSSGNGNKRPLAGVLQGGSSKTLGSILEEISKRNGWTLWASDAIKGLVRDNFFNMGQSDFGYVRQLATSVGAVAKWYGNDLYFMTATDPYSIGGSGTATIEAHWGFNLISWRIKPYTTQPQFNAGVSTWFDPVNGVFKAITRNMQWDAPFNTAKAIMALPALAPNRQVGDQHLNSMVEGRNTDRGTGMCVIYGNPAAKAQRQLTIYGARPGVDGSYLIKEAEHHYSRDGGYTTTCQLIRPWEGTQASAGT